MIKKITIKDVATFDSNGVVLDNLQKVNFIYAGNACGKTTISRVLASENIEASYPHCEVQWDGQPLQVLAYNSDFRARNFLENEQFPGVFTLGEASIEIVKELDKLTAERTFHDQIIKQADKNIEKCSDEITKLKKERQERLWKNVYKKNEEFKECLHGYMRKETFETRILEVLDRYQPKAVPTIDDLRSRYSILFASEGVPEKLEYIPGFEEQINNLIKISSAPIWARRIVGSDDVPIAALIKKLEIADWVRKGQTLLDKDSSVCPFCQNNTINSDFRHQLESFFDENYISDTETIARLKQSYNEVKLTLAALFEGIISREKSSRNSKLNTQLYSSLTQLLVDVIDTNIERISAKVKDPGIVVEFKDITEYIEHIQKISNSANQAIKEHNNMVENISFERDSLRRDFWSYLANIAKNDLLNLTYAINSKEKDLAKNRNDKLNSIQAYHRIDDDIKRIEGKVTSVSPTIHSINSALKKFGFTSFSIQPSPVDPQKYQIQREDGSFVKNTLSEGESMFISFLYYIHLLRGGINKSDLKTPKVLVIDDPISSLDSNVLFVVSTMIKQLLKEMRECTPGNESNIKQVFILTHNVYFHKKVTFITNREKRMKDWHHWVLFKKGNVSYIKSYELNNPIKGSYELLWKDLRERKDSMDNIEIQNIMRRIIENYFVVFGGLTMKNVIDPAQYDDPDEFAVATSLASWYDEGSHDIYDDLYVEHPHILTSKYMDVFENLFVKLGHEAHFNMMMQIEEGTQDAKE